MEATTLLIIIVISVATLIWLGVRSRRRGTRMPPPPQPSPYDGMSERGKWIVQTLDGRKLGKRDHLHEAIALGVRFATGEFRTKYEEIKYGIKSNAMFGLTVRSRRKYCRPAKVTCTDGEMEGRVLIVSPGRPGMTGWQVTGDSVIPR